MLPDWTYLSYQIENKIVWNFLGFGDWRQKLKGVKWNKTGDGKNILL